MVSLEIADEARTADAAALLEQLPHAARVVREGRTLHVQVEHGARALAGMVSALDNAGFSVSQASITRPSLDEVYLAVTGRSFSKADAEAAPAVRRGRA
jgi:ABC-2 type transport system ATP-binding protein